MSVDRRRLSPLEQQMLRGPYSPPELPEALSSPAEPNRLRFRRNTLNSERAVILSEQGGGEQIISKANSVTPTEVNEGAAEVMLEYGLTLPGPVKSYLSARITASVKLPCAPTPEAVRHTFNVAEQLVSERLDYEAKQANEFFDKYSSR